MLRTGRHYLAATSCAAAFAAVLMVSACASAQANAGSSDDEKAAEARKANQPPVYPPDDFNRDATQTGADNCPEVELVEYDGEFLDYNRPIEVNPYFKERLRMFERVAREVAIEVYGRPPDTVVHYGGHTCKTVGGKGEKWSEHAFGNAIDVPGFDFEALGDDAEYEVSGKAAGEFSVRLEEHWSGRAGFAGKHSKFLHRLADELARRGIFKGILGPAYPGHDKVFHMDYGLEWFHRY